MVLLLNPAYLYARPCEHFEYFPTTLWSSYFQWGMSGLVKKEEQNIMEATLIFNLLNNFKLIYYYHIKVNYSEIHKEKLSLISYPYKHFLNDYIQI